jgi:tRNA threonylcarbamoyladenosine biosynthesis protein TsaE
VAKDIVAEIKQPCIILFKAEMGGGKTTLIKEICSQLGVLETMSSPTFSVVNEYHTAENKIIYHFDLYRLKSIDECFDIGMEEYLYSGNYCFIEWPEIVMPLLAEKYYTLTIKKEKDNTRSIVFQ